MGVLAFRKKYRISLQIKDYILRSVVTREDSSSSLVNYYEKVIPEGLVEKGSIIDKENFELFLSGCAAEWKITHKPLYFFVPDSSFFFGAAKIAKDLKDQDIRKYIQSEAGATIHVPFDGAVFDYHLLENKGRKEDEDYNLKNILLFAAPEQAVNSYAALFKKAKMTPVAADIAPLSIHRLYMQKEEHAPGEELIQLEWDMNSINIGIFKDNKPVFLRNHSQPFSREDWEATAEENLVQWVCKQDEKVERDILKALKEVRQVIDYWRRAEKKGGNKKTELFLTGDHPKLWFIQKSLEDSLKMDVQTEKSIDLLSKVNMDLPGQFILPVSLCLKEV
ncbi:type IV pilus biogenesis protein PilM [Salipaludibacillus aurantiacus]|uniref:Type IV pilus assembly protein PilM n=1 Tax=Salipaludibacillus aurantiacus TaxID=1601833 RepID=A0A1H9T540_9BACI|nr:pilus assembly protein PilM [Salipaludibacillus aurantiacus]SER92342.1 type IV pilus assembly protein PilM [Salipaludibacillus aurantiacus]